MRASGEVHYLDKPYGVPGAVGAMAYTVETMGHPMGYEYMIPRGDLSGVPWVPMSCPMDTTVYPMVPMA